MIHHISMVALSIWFIGLFCFVPFLHRSIGYSGAILYTLFWPVVLLVIYVSKLETKTRPLTRRVLSVMARLEDKG